MKTIDQFNFLFKKDGSINWEEIERKYSQLIEPMKICPQHPKYHGEGNVWVHTKMVCESLVQDKSWIDLTDQFNKIVQFLAAFFHDCGKPNKTKIENGEICSHGHANEGARLTRTVLWDYQNNHEFSDRLWELREKVARLVMLHMIPHIFLRKDDPLKTIILSSQLVLNSDLLRLSRADINGRIGEPDNIKEAHENLDLFRDFCVENHCYAKEKEFPSNNARFRYLFEGKGHPDFDYYEKFHGTLHMMCGMAGSGKNYWAEELELPILELDTIRKELVLKWQENEGLVSATAKEKFKEYLRNRQSFIYNATNIIKGLRSGWIHLARQYGFEIVIHYAEPSFQIILKQNLERKNVVPEHVIEEMFKKINIPDNSECHRLEFRLENV